MTTEALSVLIVDDHPGVATGVSLLLRQRGFFIAGLCSDAATARRQVARRRPDLVIVDLDLAGASGAELAAELTSDDAGLGVVVYTGVSSREKADEALRSGARGFVLKAADPGLLVKALTTVAAGGTYIDPQINVVMGVQKRPVLSRREAEIFALLARGYTGEGVADHLTISPETVRTHVRNGMQKLGAGTRVHAVVTALARGEIAV